MKHEQMVAIPLSVIRRVIAELELGGDKDLAFELEKNMFFINEVFIVNWIGTDMEKFIIRNDPVSNDCGGVENYR